METKRPTGPKQPLLSDVADGIHPHYNDKYTRDVISASDVMYKFIVNLPDDEGTLNMFIAAANYIKVRDTK